jgi:Raf kinase inhibitor-like YbhB/YbcL family protein
LFWEAELTKELSVKSPAFENNHLIPAKYTCDGENVNPSLAIEGIPADTKTLALIVDDPDASMGTWDHWVVWNISPTGKIEENTIPGTEGVNTDGEHSYGGPCPPYGTHRYFFKVYALDVELNLNSNSRKKDLEKAMQGHVLGKGELVGLYRRSR